MASCDQPRGDRLSSDLPYAAPCFASTVTCVVSVIRGSRRILFGSFASSSLASGLRDSSANAHIGMATLYDRSIPKDCLTSGGKSLTETHRGETNRNNVSQAASRHSVFLGPRIIPVSSTLPSG